MYKLRGESLELALMGTLLPVLLSDPPLQAASMPGGEERDRQRTRDGNSAGRPESPAQRLMESREVGLLLFERVLIEDAKVIGDPYNAVTLGNHLAAQKRIGVGRCTNHLPGQDRSQAGPVVLKLGPKASPVLALDGRIDLWQISLDRLLDVGAQLASQPGRHTDGVQAGDSVGAVANGDASHTRRSLYGRPGRAKNSRFSRSSSGMDASTETRLGIAIRPLSVSATSHTRCSEPTAPR